jgi:hypothetical protein
MEGSRRTSRTARSTLRRGEKLEKHVFRVFSRHFGAFLQLTKRVEWRPGSAGLIVNLFIEDGLVGAVSSLGWLCLGDVLKRSYAFCAERLAPKKVRCCRPGAGVATFGGSVRLGVRGCPIALRRLTPVNRFEKGSLCTNGAVVNFAPSAIPPLFRGVSTICFWPPLSRFRLPDHRSVSQKWPPRISSFSA